MQSSASHVDCKVSPLTKHGTSSAKHRQDEFSKESSYNKVKEPSKWKKSFENEIQEISECTLIYKKNGLVIHTKSCCIHAKKIEHISSLLSITKNVQSICR